MPFDFRRTWPMEIHAGYAKRIDWISKYPKEDEVLFAAPTEFSVKRAPVFNSETGLLEIKLDEVP